MTSSNGGKAPSKEPHSFIRTSLTKLRRRHIIETLAAFIAGGWLFLEFVDRILIAHYELNKKWLDVSFITLLAALLCIILWRWFSSTEKRPGNVKVEVLLVPLIVVVALAIDLNLILQMAGVPGKKLLIGIVALCFGVAWVIFKSLQWAASTPGVAVRKFDISKLAEIKFEKSIVVLPFADLSPQKDQDYFCDGMTEEIITDLSYIHELRVISRNSAMMLKGTPKDTGTIGRELNVQYVLEGSVRKAGNDLKITAQLIDALNDAHLWAEKYSGTLDDVFDIQEKVSRSIVDALKLKLNTKEQQQIAERSIGSIAAYECYLKAYHEIYHLTKESIDQGIKTLQNGLEIYGKNARLYATLGEAYYLYFDVGIETDETVLKRAEEYALKALAVQPDSAKGHKLLGLLERGHGNLTQAYRHMIQAYKIDPNDAGIMLYTGSFLGWYAGRPALANSIFKKLLEIDPLTSTNYIFISLIPYSQGQLSRAIDLARKAFQMNPEFAWGRFWIAYYLAADGQKTEVLEIVDQTVGDQGVDTIIKELLLFLKYALCDDYEKALETLSPRTKKYTWNDPDFSALMPGFFSMVNEKEEAFRYMEHALARGFINYPFYTESGPFLTSIRSEPRFQKLMERVKYEWEHFEV